LLRPPFRKRGFRMGGPWTANSDYLKEQVISLHSQGLSASVIGTRLGRTKNAICGIIYRLRQQGVINTPLAEGRKERRERARAASVRLVKAGRILCKPKPREPRTIETAPIPLPREEDTARVSFADLERHHCRFICCAEAGEAVAAGKKLYCGLKQVHGTSYCEGHLARVSPAATIVRKELSELREVEHA